MISKYIISPVLNFIKEKLIDSKFTAKRSRYVDFIDDFLEKI